MYDDYYTLEELQLQHQITLEQQEQEQYETIK